MARKGLAAAIGLGVMAAGVALAGCASASPEAETTAEESPAMTLRISHGFTSTSAENVELLEVAERVSERTDGKLTLQVFPDATIGAGLEPVELAVSGGDVIAFIDASGASTFGAPEMNILSGPFLFESTEQAVEFQSTDLFAEWTSQLEDNGLKVLAMNWLDQARDVIGDASYADPSDIAGVKIRIPPLPAYLATFEAVGAVGVEMPTADVFSAIDQSVISAAEAAPNAMFNYKWPEVAQQLTLTGHIQPVTGYGMSAEIFDSMPEDYQTVLLEEFWAGGTTVTETHAATTADTISKMESDFGVTVHEADVDAWREATAGFYDAANHPEWRADLLETVQGLID